MRRLIRTISLILLATLAIELRVAAAEPASPAARLFAERCGICHDHPQDRVPTHEALTKRTPEDVVRALSIGVMKPQAGGLTALEIGGLATYLTGKAPGLDVAPGPELNPCADNPAFRIRQGGWNGWGRDVDNSRYQPRPHLSAVHVPRLKLKWAYGFHSSMVYGQPTVVGGRLFVTSSSGRIYSLDASSGCTYWTFDAPASSRTAISIGLTKKDVPGSAAAFFGDDTGAVYALDAQSGKLLWKTQADTHPLARITGAPTYYDGRLYVPVSSSEEGVAQNPRYNCCTFRGSIVALDAANGHVAWTSYTVASAAKPYRESEASTQQFGPAGVAIWSAPTIDPHRGLLYAATGNSYTSYDEPMADAVIALDLKDGTPRWVQQVTPKDNWIVGCVTEPAACPPGRQCRIAGQGNCPLEVGPDYDLGNSPLLTTLPDGRQIISVGQKSGMAYGLDPDANGKLLWRVKVGEGSSAGGIQWGMAADGRNVYAAIANPMSMHGSAPGGVSALDALTGEVRWHTPAPQPVCNWGPRNCTQAQPQAVSVMPGIVFEGALDGHLRAYSTRDGRILWDFDTAQDYPTVNKVPGSGGSLDHGGSVIVDGMLFVNSGYGRIVGQPGNLLLAFSVDGQ